MASSFAARPRIWKRTKSTNMNSRLKSDVFVCQSRPGLFGPALFMRFKGKKGNSLRESRCAQAPFFVYNSSRLIVNIRRFFEKPARNTFAVVGKIRSDLLQASDKADTARRCG